jgi:hypothetical protein
VGFTPRSPPTPKCSRGAYRGVNRLRLPLSACKVVAVGAEQGAVKTRKGLADERPRYGIRKCAAQRQKWRRSVRQAFLTYPISFLVLPVYRPKRAREGGIMPTARHLKHSFLRNTKLIGTRGGSPKSNRTHPSATVQMVQRAHGADATRLCYRLTPYGGYFPHSTPPSRIYPTAERMSARLEYCSLARDIVALSSGRIARRLRARR